jgi:hypothetical protein
MYEQVGTRPDAAAYKSCTRKEMVLDTATLTVQSPVESHLSIALNEGDF